MSRPKFELTPSNAFSPCAKTIVEPDQVAARLRELSPDLSLDLLFNVTVSGLGARNDTTSASAATAPGMQQWFKTVEQLRTSLSAKGWHIYDRKNCPFISTQDELLSIVVMTGNRQTGLQGDEDPANQAEKGVVANDFIQANRQLELFSRDVFSATKEEQKETEVWVFLYHYDKKSKEVRFELSYPTGFDNKKITSWGERLILGSTPNNPDEFTIRKDTPNAPATVEVEPKAGTF